jgi:hypothetical protein
VNLGFARKAGILTRLSVRSNWVCEEPYKETREIPKGLGTKHGARGCSKYCRNSKSGSLISRAFLT